MASHLHSPLLAMASRMPILVALLLLSNHIISVYPCFTAIFSIGDSIADTGNRLISTAGGGRSGRLPYGETYFHRPTGRYSDGRLLIDFIAEAIGLPLIPPYLAGQTGHEDFRGGMNFAVATATALDHEFFRQKGLNVWWTNYTLSVQMQLFKQMLPSLCTSKSDCINLFNKSLFLMGEIGGNDYNHPFFEQRTADEIRTYVPFVIKVIISAINDLIELGAKTLVVPGNFPIGCMSSYLTLYQSQSKEDYEPESGCLKWLNEFAEYHNHQLIDELDRLRQQHSDVTIIYADYYGAAMRLFRYPNKFGFNKPGLSACCGGGGPYNFRSTSECGMEEGWSVCENPSKYICWDGFHLTEAAYKIVADGILNGPYAVPPILSLCSNKATNSLDKVTNSSLHEWQSL